MHFLLSFYAQAGPTGKSPEQLFKVDVLSHDWSYVCGVCFENFELTWLVWDWDFVSSLTIPVQRLLLFFCYFMFVLSSSDDSTF